MNLIVHAELSWLAAQGLSARRDRRLVMLAGMAPDLDGLGLFFGHSLYETYHHVLFHNCLGAVLCAVIFGAFATRRLAVAGLAFFAFHLHLLCDLAGSGVFWPIAYFWPVSRHFYGWSGSWELVSWQNTVIGMFATLACLAAALRWNRTIVEVFSTVADARVVAAVRGRAGRSESPRSRVDGTESE